MQKLPKTIYVRIETEGDLSYLIPTETPDEHASLDETRIVGVYKLVNTVEVSTQIKQEVVVKKSPSAKKKDKPIAVEMPQDRDALLDAMRTD